MSETFDGIHGRRTVAALAEHLVPDAAVIVGVALIAAAGTALRAAARIR